MRRAEGLALAAALLSLAAFAGCGFINGAGVPHLLHEDQVALCRYCTQSDQVCVARQNGALGCSDFSQLNWCNAAENLFFQYETDGPYVTVKPSQGDWQEGFRSDCPEGRNAYFVEALVIDPQNDVVVDDEWDVQFDPLEDGEKVAIIHPDQTDPILPERWDSQVFTSDTGADTAYSIEVTFCLGFELDDAVALQITDDGGHHSNPVCFAAP
jgi:hypothetical protein